MTKKSNRNATSRGAEDRGCSDCAKKDKVIVRLTRDDAPQQMYYDEKWLAIHLGMSVKSVQKMRYSGAGPKVTLIGRSVRYRKRDVTAYRRRLAVESDKKGQF